MLKNLWNLSEPVSKCLEDRSQKSLPKGAQNKSEDPGGDADVPAPLGHNEDSRNRPTAVQNMSEYKDAHS